MGLSETDSIERVASMVYCANYRNTGHRMHMLLCSSQWKTSTRVHRGIYVLAGQALLKESAVLHYADTILRGTALTILPLPIALTQIKMALNEIKICWFVGVIFCATKSVTSLGCAIAFTTSASWTVSTVRKSNAMGASDSYAQSVTRNWNRI